MIVKIPFIKDDRVIRTINVDNNRNKDSIIEDIIELVYGNEFVREREVFIYIFMNKDGFPSAVLRGEDGEYIVSYPPSIHYTKKNYDISGGFINIHNHPMGLLCPSRADLSFVSKIGNNNNKSYIVSSDIQLRTLYLLEYDSNFWNYDEGKLKVKENRNTGVHIPRHIYDSGKYKKIQIKRK